MVTQQENKPNTLDWKQLHLDQSDLDFIYNHLLEKEVPMTSKELARAIIVEKIRLFKKSLEKQQKKLGKLYRPAEAYQAGETVTFPLLSNLKAIAAETRKGNNPDISDFTVTEFEFEDGKKLAFATNLQEHSLNTLDYAIAEHKALLDEAKVVSTYGPAIARQIHKLLSESQELFDLADFWFPKALLADVNPGYLNLAEAALEMEEGNPVPTKNILDAIEYPMDSNEKLTEFSFNYALKQDDRFDEVGPVGNVLWTLKLLEPEDVRKKPLTLHNYTKDVELPENVCFPFEDLAIHDELDQDCLKTSDENEDCFDLCINYPHWKAGTLPLIRKDSLFPTALETDKVVFDFVDTGQTLPLARMGNYSGKLCLRVKVGIVKTILPGSKIRISKNENHSKVNISLIPPRSSKDWIRTALFDSKGKLYFETRQQPDFNRV